MAGYASGKYAKGMCQRCGDVYPRRALREDGDNGLLVCPPCYDIPHPSERPVDASDSTALYKPAVDLDKAASTVIDFDPMTTALGFDRFFGGGT